MRRIARSKTFKLAIKTLVSAVFIAWLIFKVNWGEVAFYLGQVSYPMLAIYLAVVVLGILVSSIKWKMLAEFKGIRRPLWDFFKFYLTGTFINNFMPGFLGGDAYKAYEIGRENGQYAQSASSVMMDRITGLVGATILALLFGLLNIRTILASKVLLLFFCLIIASLAFDILLAKVRNMPFVKKQGKKLLPKKIVDFFYELGLYSADHGILAKSIAMGGLFSIVGMAAANYILLSAFGVRIGLVDYLSVVFIITIVSSVPISINNIGLKEWAFVTFFGIFGVNAAAVTAVSIVSRFLQMLLSFFALPIYLKTKKDRKKIADNPSLG